MITPEYLRRITERMQRIAEDMEDDMLVAIIMALLTQRGPSAYEQLVAIAAEYGAYGYAEIEKAFRHATLQMAETAGKQAALRVLDQFAQPEAEKTADEMAKRAAHNLEQPTTQEQPQRPQQPTPTPQQEPTAQRPGIPATQPETPGQQRLITPAEAARDAARERVNEILQDDTREWAPEEARKSVEEAAEEAARETMEKRKEGDQALPEEPTEDLQERETQEAPEDMQEKSVTETAQDAAKDAVQDAAEDSAQDATEDARPVVDATKTNWRNLTETEAYAGNEAYVRAVDRAYLRVTTEGISLDQAIREAVQELAEQGITMVGEGRREHVDVAVARNLRTAIARLAGDIALKQAIENGYTLVLVSAHLGARPTHEEWQGKVYSIVGETAQYKDFYAATGYRTKLGLCGINCRHTFAPWKEGMGNPWEGINPEESRKRYDLEQEQRRREREIRAGKRRVKAAQAEVSAAKPGSSAEAEAKATLKSEKAELAAARKEYKEFCAENNLRELTERLQVYD